jgi:microcompartment protein CcmK/EutM
MTAGEDSSRTEVLLHVGGTREVLLHVRGTRLEHGERPKGACMQLGKVVGTVVATRKEQTLEGLKFMLVRQVDAEGQETGGFVVAADAVGAGPGELVLVASGSSARQTQVTNNRPVDAVIMAIVDTWEVGRVTKYKK